MSLNSLPRLATGEVPIMQVVWDSGPVTVRAVLDWVNGQRKEPLSRNTILKQMQRLEEKGWLRRAHQGRPATYEATVDRETAAQSMTKSLRDGLFAGSPLALVRCVIDGSQLTTDQLGELRQMVDDATAANAQPED